MTILRNTGLPGHCPLEISFDFSNQLDHKFVFRTPQSIPVKSGDCSEAQVASIEDEIWQPVLADFVSAIANSNVDKAFAIWTAAAEKVCLHQAQTMLQPVGKKHVGRGRKPVAIKTPIQAAPASASTGAATHKLSSLLKLQRRLDQLVHKLQHAPADPQCSAYEQLTQLCANITRSWRRLFNYTPWQSSLPSLSVAQELGVQIRKCISVESQCLTEKRCASFKQKLIADWSSSRKHTYAWVKDQVPFMTPCFKSGLHEYATKHNELHSMMCNAWEPIFNRYRNDPSPSYEQFLHQFPMALAPDRTYTAAQPVELPPITAVTLRDLISDLSNSSPGVDAWQIDELKLLGEQSIYHLAQLYNLIESTSTWPTNLLDVPVVCLKKGTGDTPLDFRPISLTSHLYRLWSKCRWKQLQQWHFSWCPPQLKGGVSGRETIDAYFQLATEVEHALVFKQSLYGIFYDYTKCFDNVAWSIEQGILRDLGLPTHILDTMFSFNQNILRRFKIGNSVGPSFGNANSICQGCPLAILRINALISAWVNVVHSHPSIPSCRTGAFIDDRNLRTPSHSTFQDCIRITQQFDTAIGAIINENKTHVFATTAQGRKQLASGSFGVVSDDKLLGAHLSFTRERSKASCAVAKRITICPLNTQAREVLLSTSMAPKFSFGLELGSCDVKIERTFRSVVSRALWSKGNHKCNNMLFTLCHKGHLFDPTQLKIYIPFKICRRQLVKHPSLQPHWRHIWEQSTALRNNYKDGRSTTVGPLSTLFHMSKLLGWEWIEPFVFTWRFSQDHIISTPFLHVPEAYFHHLVRLAINRMLWSKASSSRKNLRGVHVGIDKDSTVKLLDSPVLSPYDKGILRAILADGIATQKYLFSTKQALQHPVCKFCWQEVESLEHMFWHCEAWNGVRRSHLADQRLFQCQQLPLPTQRTGIFLSTNAQSNQFVLSHQQILNGSHPHSLPSHDCTFIQQIQRTMVDIIEARNQTDPSDPPDDFDPSPFLLNRPVPANSAPCQAFSQPGNFGPDSKVSAARPSKPKPTHSPEGLLLSTSNRTWFFKISICSIQRQNKKAQCMHSL